MKDLNELKEKVRAFVEERDWHRFHSPKNLSMALIVEAAELVEQFQWLTEEESANLSPAKRQAVEEEMADILVYLTSLATKLNVDLLAAAEAKLIKNGQKYPAERVRGDARKYDEY
jgi:NTP pyrophosphatase (non-canonical NTP hydrolase)